MDSVQLSARSATIDGLRLMMDAADDAGGLVNGFVDVSIALLIIEIAKRAQDKPEWFPHGKWATIQSIGQSVDERIDEQLRQAQFATLSNQPKDKGIQE